MRPINLSPVEINIIRAAFEKAHGLKKSDAIKKIERKFIRAQTPITTASAKAKGRRLQQWTCEKIAELLGVAYDQSDDDCLIHSREMGQSGTDVIIRTAALKEKFPFAIECKATEAISFPRFLEQAKGNTREGEYALIVIKNSQLDEPIVAMEWNAFAKLFLGVI